jgi:hypothetical protein
MVSQWVRLIGGAHHGQVEKVEADQVEIIRSTRRPIVPFRSNLGIETIITRYTRREARAPAGDVIVFFAETELSDLEALLQVLGP